MIKFLKKLWKRCFGYMGDSRIKISSTATPVVISQPKVAPKPLHCDRHTRFKKSCASCQEAIK